MRFLPYLCIFSRVFDAYNQMPVVFALDLVLGVVTVCVCVCVFSGLDRGLMLLHVYIWLGGEIKMVLCHTPIPNTLFNIHGLLYLP